MIEIHEGSGNVYADLGFPDADAMLVKAQLAGRIANISVPRVRGDDSTRYTTQFQSGARSPRIRG